MPFAASGVASYLVIDGQQRLTTLMLILCAIRDAAAIHDPGAIERNDELYLINKFNGPAMPPARTRSARPTASSEAISNSTTSMARRSTWSG
jgi:hypothetical protein